MACCWITHKVNITKYHKKRGFVSLQGQTWQYCRQKQLLFNSTLVRNTEIYSVDRQGLWCTAGDINRNHRTWPVAATHLWLCESRGEQRHRAQWGSSVKIEGKTAHGLNVVVSAVDLLFSLMIFTDFSIWTGITKLLTTDTINYLLSPDIIRQWLLLQLYVTLAEHKLSFLIMQAMMLVIPSASGLSLDTCRAHSRIRRYREHCEF